MTRLKLTPRCSRMASGANRNERTKDLYPNLNLASWYLVVNQQPCRCSTGSQLRRLSCLAYIKASIAIYHIKNHRQRAKRPRSHIMTDPLSITCGITSLASAACNLCSTIYQTIDSIRGAPKQIRNLSIDLRGLYSVLGTLKGYLDDEEMVSGVMHPATSADLEAVLSNCAMIFKDINAKVNGFQRAPGTSDLALWRRLQWNWKEKGVVALRARLANHTRTL